MTDLAAAEIEAAARLADGVDETERELRRRMWQHIAAAHARDADGQAELADINARRAVGNARALAILDRLQRDQDVQAFQAELQRWALDPANGYRAFDGFNGQMFVNQLAKQAGEGPPGLGRLLAAALAAPTDEQDAVDKIGELVAWVEAVKKGAHPAPAKVPFLCSFFWSMQDYDRWPCIWRSAEATLTGLGWLDAPPGHGSRYLAYRREVLALGDRPTDIEDALWWFEKNVDKVGLDPTLVARCARLVALRSELSTDLPTTTASPTPSLTGASPSVAGVPDGGGDGDSAGGRRALGIARTTARCVLGSLRLYGQALQDQVTKALAVKNPVKVVVPRLAGSSLGDGVRSDGWVDWRLAEPQVPACGLTLMVTVEGVSLLLSGSAIDAASHPDVARAVLDEVPSGMQAFRNYSDRPERIVAGVPAGWRGGVSIGRRFPGEQALGRADFAHDVLAAAADLQPLFDKVVRASGGRPSTVEKTMVPDPDPLLALIEEFRDGGYPSEKDQAQRADRAALAAALQPEELPIIDLGLLRSVVNTGRYGMPGPQALLNTTLRDATPTQLDEILGKLGDLLWGDDPDEQRIDRLLDADHAVRGLGEPVTMKLLAICHPDRYVPVFPYGGDLGKANLMRLIGLDPPPATDSRGRRQVKANDAIRERLDPFFPNDPWGQAQFLYWLRTRGQAPAPDDLAGEIDQAADDLHLDPTFLHEAVELLRDKGQVIFYGPPGTGKTYVARRLAKALVPDPSRRMVVQFHPSTSYEDFFEGYRPETVEGQVSYRLTPGPLALLATRASEAPGIDHVLVVDEVNRANVPKVLGELLYLLEYRDERIRTLYRPDDAFELPRNLLLIGTMNTADRSIALVDAALRRRFHFLPFFPHERPVEGLLGRWLEARGQPRWPAELVDQVNDELRDELGGRDLQIGPSYFMRDGLDEVALRRIWTYAVHPMLEDVLYGSGNDDRIDRFRFDAVYDRFLGRLGGPDALTTTDEPSER